MFQQKLKDRIAKINASCGAALPLPVERIELEFNKPSVALYNIHKRSLPVRLDKPVAFGLTKEDGIKAMIVLKAQLLPEQAGVVYFDLVPQDVPAYQKSVFYNEGPFVVEEPHGGQPEPEVGRVWDFIRETELPRLLV